MHIITDLDIGGAEMTLYRVLSRLDKQRFKNMVVSLRPCGLLGENIQSLGIPVYGLGMNPGMVPIMSLFRLVKLVLSWRPRIIQTWLYHADLIGILIAKATGVKKVVWNIRCSDMHLQHYAGSTRCVLKVCAILSRLPQAVITNSHSAKEYHEGAGYHPKQFMVIPNGFDTSNFFPEGNARSRLCEELGIPKDNVLVGLVARFDPMKDHKTFLRAASRVGERYPGVHFILVGRGVDTRNRTLWRWINEERLNSRVHLLGQQQEIHRILAGLDVACSSSSFGEGFSNTIGEAMACAVPCVVTNVGDSARIVGETGKVVPPKTPDALANAIIELLELPFEERQELGNAARERVRKCYSLDKTVRDYEKVYLSIAGR